MNRGGRDCRPGSFLLSHYESCRGGRHIKEKLRINLAIRVPLVRLVDENGAQVGVVPIQEALKMSDERGFDLVEVAAGANPPVCRLLDFGKFKYEQSKRVKEAKKKQKVVQIKEVKVRPKTDEGDLQTKCRKIREFIADGDKVKVAVFFRGREHAHHEVGFKVLNRMKEILGAEVSIERDAALDGKVMVMILIPPR